MMISGLIWYLRGAQRVSGFGLRGALRGRDCEKAQKVACFSPISCGRDLPDAAVPVPLRQDTLHTSHRPPDTAP